MARTLRTFFIDRVVRARLSDRSILGGLNFGQIDTVEDYLASGWLRRSFVVAINMLFTLVGFGMSAIFVVWFTEPSEDTLLFITAGPFFVWVLLFGQSNLRWTVRHFRAPHQPLGTTAAKRNLRAQGGRRNRGRQRTLVTNRGRSILYLVPAAALVAGSVWLIIDGTNLDGWRAHYAVPAGYLGAVFFSLGTLAIIRLIIHPVSLTFDSRGMTLTGLQGGTYQWEDVDGPFQIWSHAGTDIVTFRSDPTAGNLVARLLGPINERTMGSNRALPKPELFGMSADELASFANDYRHER